MATVSHAHIEPNAEGEPIIAVTRIKVRMIALDRIARGWDAEEIQRHHPDLSLGQIHSRWRTTSTTSKRWAVTSRTGTSASPGSGPERASHRAGTSLGSGACSREEP